MALTAKPISTISYNSEGFLTRLLDRMISAKIIVDYRYIRHYGENGQKDHWHVWLEPNKRLDTGVLMDEFKEVDPNNDKPLGCMPFRTSKSGHWLMYALHDPDYLKAHQSDNDGDGKIEYKISDIHTPYEEQLYRDYNTAMPLKQTENQQIIALVKAGMTVTEICSVLNVNPSKAATLWVAYQREKVDLHNKDRKDYETSTEEKLLDAFHEVKVEEVAGATKSEKALGLTRVLVTTKTLDPDTGEVSETKKWEVRDEEQTQLF